MKSLSRLTCGSLKDSWSTLKPAWSVPPGFARHVKATEAHRRTPCDLLPLTQPAVSAAARAVGLFLVAASLWPGSTEPDSEEEVVLFVWVSGARLPRGSPCQHHPKPWCFCDLKEESHCSTVSICTTASLQQRQRDRNPRTLQKPMLLHI